MGNAATRRFKTPDVDNLHTTLNFWEDWGPEDINKGSFKQGVCPATPGLFVSLSRDHGPTKNILYCTVI